MADTIPPHIRAATTRVSKARLSPTVRALAEEQGISLTRLATLVGYKNVNGLLAGIEGRSAMPMARLFGIAAHLKVWSIEELFGPSGTTDAIRDLGEAP